MSEMVERVAKALFASRRTILPLARWDQLTDAGREQYRFEARAAIEAMRGPTEEMSDLGTDEFCEGGDASSARSCMIDAALGKVDA